MADWGWLNFYIPLGNFILFVVLFVLAFRKSFSGMARKQREGFLEAKLEAEKERRLLEKELEDLLFREREQAKSLQAMREQAVKDSEKRAQQIIEDARFHGARILEESKRLVDAEYERAHKSLKKDLVEQMEQLTLQKISKDLGSQERKKYTQGQLQSFGSLASPS